MSMFSAKLVRDWTNKIHPNLRYTYDSVINTAGWWIYENTQRLSDEWSRVWECDGTTGPANAGDNTQRLTSIAACATRATGTTTAQSWGLYENSDGVQLLISHTGSADGVIRIAYSPGGNYALQGTATYPPTASDEVIISNGNSIVASTASLDRAMTIWCHDKDWRCAVWRNGSLVRLVYLVEVEPLTANTVFGPLAPGYPAYVGGHATSAARGQSSQITGGIVTGTAIGATNDVYPRARVFTNGAGRNIKVGGGEIPIPGNSSIIAYASTPGNQTGPAGSMAALQGNKTPLVPIFWGGHGAANSDGYLGVPRDWRLGLIASLTLPATNDFFDGYDPDDQPGVSGGSDGSGAPRTNWWAAIDGPCCVWPWRDVASSIDTGL